MIQKAINSLSDNARRYCEDIQKTLYKQSVFEKYEICNYYINKLKGYLECLVDSGQINQSDFIVLYSFYSTL